jgi:hypothetical protein
MIAELRAEISEEASHLATALTSLDVKDFFVSEGYKVCSVAPITDTSMWFAILIKNREFLTANVFTNRNTIESFEVSVI